MQIESVLKMSEDGIAFLRGNGDVEQIAFHDFLVSVRAYLLDFKKLQSEYKELEDLYNGKIAKIKSSLDNENAIQEIKDILKDD